MVLVVPLVLMVVIVQYLVLQHKAVAEVALAAPHFQQQIAMDNQAAVGEVEPKPDILVAQPHKDMMVVMGQLQQAVAVVVQDKQDKMLLAASA